MPLTYPVTPGAAAGWKFGPTAQPEIASDIATMAMALVAERSLLLRPLAIAIAFGDCDRITGNLNVLGVSRAENLSKRRRHDQQNQRPDEHTTGDDGGQRTLHVAADPVGNRGGEQADAGRQRLG